MKKWDSTKIELNKEETDIACEKLIAYFQENFEMEIGNLRAGIFLDFLSDEIGKYYYNKAVADAAKYMEDKVDDMFLLMK